MSETAVEEPHLATRENAAQMLGIGRTAVYELLRAGDLRAIPIGRSRRIPLSELHNLVANRLVAGSGVESRRV